MTTREDITPEELQRMAQLLEKYPELFRIVRAFEPASLMVAQAAIPPDACYVVIVDTESTGKDIEVDQIIELGMVELAYDEMTGHVFGVTRTFNQLEEPTIPISEGAGAVNGITMEMVAGQRINDAEVADMVSRAQFCICHNARFDRPLLERRFSLFKELDFACSMAQVPWAEAGIGSSKQEYIASMLGFFYTAHRAEGDCMALAKILISPIGLLDGDTPFQRILETYREVTCRVYASGAAYSVKGILSDRQYKWADGVKEGTEKAWWIDVPESDLEAELAWLKASCFYGRGVSVPVDTVTAMTRFSSRRGETTRLIR